MSATYKDIQRLTGLSLSTISKYFNKGNVRKQNREAIEKAVRTLDYRVHEFARSLKSGRSNTIGILIPNLSGAFNAAVMEKVCETLRKNGYGSIVCTCNADRNTEAESLAFLMDKLVDGIITIPMHESGSHLKAAASRGIPVVLIDHLTPQFKADSVTVDNLQAGRMAAREFLSFGHKRLGVISGPNEMDTMFLRSKGFCSAIKKASPDISLLQERAELSIQGGYTALKKLITAHIPPTGIFCANYELTLGAYIALRDMQKRIPEDISLIGFDNMMLAGILEPPLTMIAQPIAEIGRTAASLMLQRLDDPEFCGYRNIELKTQLFKGNSLRRI